MDCLLKALRRDEFLPSHHRRALLGRHPYAAFTPAQLVARNKHHVADSKLLVARNKLRVARNMLLQAKQQVARNLLRWCKRGITITNCIHLSAGFRTVTDSVASTPRPLLALPLTRHPRQPSGTPSLTDYLTDVCCQLPLKRFCHSHNSCISSLRSSGKGQVTRQLLQHTIVKI